MTDKRLHFEGNHSFEEGSTFVINKDGGMEVSVAEEQAVDSYNQSFTCHATLSKENAIRLRDWLYDHFK